MLIAVAALVGVFGPGPVSQMSRSDVAGLLQVGYERFTRHVGSSSMQLQVRPGPDQPGTAQVWISSEYLAGVQAQQVRPEPEAWAGVPGAVVLAFPVSGPDPIEVALQIRPDRIGMVRGGVGVPGREPVGSWQLVYP